MADFLDSSPMLGYIEIILDNEVDVGYVYWEFMKRQGWNEPMTLDSPEPDSDNPGVSIREPQAPLLRFLRVCVLGDNKSDPVTQDISVLQSLLLLHPLLQIQYVTFEGGSMKLDDPHMEISKEFPGRVEILKIQENGAALPKLVNIAETNLLGYPSR